MWKQIGQRSQLVLADVFAVEHIEDKRMPVHQVAVETMLLPSLLPCQTGPEMSGFPLLVVPLLCCAYAFWRDKIR